MKIHPNFLGIGDVNRVNVFSLAMTSNIEVLAISKKDGDNLIAVLKEAAAKAKTDTGSVIELAYSYDPERNVNVKLY